MATDQDKGQGYGGLARPVSSTLADEVTQQIAAAIRSGELAPGTRLIESRIAEQMSISRGPIREAFRNLAQYGLVDMHPHRGTFVVYPSREALMEMVIARGLIEGFAARVVSQESRDSVVPILVEAVEKMRAAAAANQPKQLNEQIRIFHEALVRGSKSSTMLTMWEQIFDRVKLILSHENPILAEADRVVERNEFMLRALDEAPDLTERLVRSVIQRAGFEWLGMELPGYLSDPQVEAMIARTSMFDGAQP